MEDLFDPDPMHILLTIGIWALCMLILWRMFFTGDMRVLPKIFITVLSLPIIWVIMKGMAD